MKLKHPKKIYILIFTGVLFMITVACSFSVFSEPTATLSATCHTGGHPGNN